MQNPEGQHMPEQAPQELQEPERRSLAADEATATKFRADEGRRRSRPASDEADLDSRQSRGGLQSAIIVGIIAGVLTVLINVGITFLNTPLFQQALREGKNLAMNTALPLLGVECLNFFVSLVVCFAAGFFVGRITVGRQSGFIAAMLTGIINYLGSFVVRYIPNYPGNMASNTVGGTGALAGGVVVVIVFLLIWGMIGGLVGLWGAGMAGRRRPAYRD
jgi:hypothetical protein